MAGIPEKLVLVTGAAGALGRVVARGLPTPNDGTVCVAETELAAACDRIVLPVTHTSMLFSPRVARQTATFLRCARFDHAAGAD